MSYLDKKKKKYQCENCGLVFTSGWSNEEAQQEAKILFSKEELEETVIVCDGCFKVIMGELI